MSAALNEQIRNALKQFSSKTRLYAFTIADDANLDACELLVEAFAANDEVQGIEERDVIVLSTDAHMPLEPLLGQRATLEVSLANGSRTSFAGDITRIAMLGSDGAFARYRLRLSPWLWRLSQVRNCRVWQDTTIIDVVDSVFESYLPMARWRWSDEVRHFMDDAVPRGYCCLACIAHEFHREGMQPIQCTFRLVLFDRLSHMLCQHFEVTLVARCRQRIQFSYRLITE